MTTHNVGQAGPSPQTTPIAPPKVAQPPLQPEGALGQGYGISEPRASLWANLPADMRCTAQWAVAGADKAPMAATSSGALRNVSVNRPNEWMSFELACQVASANAALETTAVNADGSVLRQTGLDVGFILTEVDPFACIDLDVKATTPPAHLQRYERIISTFDSYTERSRSGVGFHVWVRGSIGKGRRRDGVEVYSQERFIICTGATLSDRPISDRPDLLAQLVSEMGADPTVEVGSLGSDGPDFALATRAAEDEGELGRLYAGNWEGRYPSQSEADLALVKLLLPHTDSLGECWRTFQLSKLGQRDKSKRLDYAQSTLATAHQHLDQDAAALAHGQSLCSSLFWRPPARSQRHFQLLRDGQLEALPQLRWLVKGIIPDAGIGAIYGESGSFKSFLTLDLLAHISNGKEWFGRKVRAAPAVYVPFEGQGGIPNRIKAWRLAEAARRDPTILLSVVPQDGIETNVAVLMDPLNLREKADREKLVTTLIETGWAGGVLCIDTLAHASSGLDENSSAMAEMITIFRDLQQQLGGVILLIHHSGKDQSRGMRGWSGLHAAMDFVVECQRPKDQSAEAHFGLSKVKDGAAGNNFSFSMQPIQIGMDEDGDGISSLVVVPAVAPDGFEPQQTVAQRDTEDDEFVWSWVSAAVARQEYPSGRSLEGQREQQMCQMRPITQKRLRDAIHRLRAASRLVDADEKAPSGNTFMVAM